MRLIFETNTAIGDAQYTTQTGDGKLAILVSNLYTWQNQPLRTILASKSRCLDNIALADLGGGSQGACPFPLPPPLILPKHKVRMAEQFFQSLTFLLRPHPLIQSLLYSTPPPPPLTMKSCSTFCHYEIWCWNSPWIVLGFSLAINHEKSDGVTDNLI